MTLPIYEVLPDLLAALSAGPNAVLIGPPGAGKTTRVAPALLDAPWRGDGEIWLLSPRRLAARAAAERIAELIGEPVGRTVGYATRMDSKRGPQTRLLVVTQGIFRNRIQADPELAGVAAVLFDEVHERTLDGDFSLALALDSQSALRPDVRLVAMSATLDGARFARLLGDAPVIESAGRMYPLGVRHIGRDAALRIEDDMAGAIRRALAEEEGGILAFLPGMGEIARTAERLDGLGPGVVVHQLHGNLDPALQRAAIRPDPDGRRKIVLATAIAETSLTLDGIRVVIDSGLARRARHDKAADVTRLVTERVSQAAATQRAGRAARQGPGVAIRLWEEAATAGLIPYDPPELFESDLAGLVLDCAIWGVRDPAAQLRWLDPPPAAGLAEARARLVTLGAVDADGAPSPHGRAMASFPLPPRLAHMMLAGAAAGIAEPAGAAAMLLTEYGLGGTDTDLEVRLRRWQGDRSPRAQSARRMADRFAALAMAAAKTQVTTRGATPVPRPAADGDALAMAVALAFPDRVAKRRNADGTDWITRGGRGYRLAGDQALARQPWIVIADAQGSAAGAMIRAAVAIDASLVETLFADAIAPVRTVRFDPASGAAQARVERRLGAIRLASGPDPSPDPAMVRDALIAGVRAGGLALLPWSKETRRLRQRAGYAGCEAVSDDRLIATLDDWLGPLLDGVVRLDRIDPAGLRAAIEQQIDWDGMRDIDRVAPNQFVSPAGSHHDIDYDAPGGPTVELRVQALFGQSEHPAIGRDRIALILSLTSPAGRPIQTTRDLPGFWAGSWRDVAKEMRGRYPKHPWPDDPAAAAPTLRTKRAAR